MKFTDMVGSRADPGSAAHFFEELHINSRREAKNVQSRFSSTKRTSFVARVQQGKKQRLFNVNVGS